MNFISLILTGNLYFHVISSLTNTYWYHHTRLAFYIWPMKKASVVHSTIADVETGDY